MVDGPHAKRDVLPDQTAPESGSHADSKCIRAPPPIPRLLVGLIESSVKGGRQYRARAENLFDREGVFLRQRERNVTRILSDGRVLGRIRCCDLRSQAQRGSREDDYQPSSSVTT